MICRQFEQLAPQMARNELRDAKLLQDALNHAALCANCDTILVEAREVAASVMALAAHDKAIDSAGHLEFTLRAAFARERGSIEDQGDLKVAPTKSWASNVFLGGALGWRAFSLAGAAIVLAIILVPGIVGHKSEPNRVAVTPARVSSPSVAQTTAAPAMETVAAPTQNRLVAVHRRKKNLAEPEETLTGFLALPYADDISTIEYGAILRLQMSRADLAWYGLPVPISDNGQKITADLFVNGSGTPEAIRLVR
jgi:hypothetical protein